MNGQPQQPKIKPRRFRLRIQTLLGVAIALGILLFCLAILMPNGQLRAVAIIEAKGGSVGYNGNPIYLRRVRQVAGYYNRVDAAIICDDDSAQYLDVFPSLKSLHLMGPKITDEAIDSIKTLPRIVHLDLVNTSVSGSKLVEIQSLPKLCIVSFEKENISKEFVAGLSKLKTTLAIHLSASGIDDEDLNRLQKQRIRMLSIDDSKVTDAGMAYLGNISEMDDLCLIRTRITDEGLKHIARLSRLEGLDLSGNDITDEGLKALDDLDRLKSIRLSNTKVTAEGKAKFQAKHPKTGIVP